MQPRRKLKNITQQGRDTATAVAKTHPSIAEHKRMVRSTNVKIENHEELVEEGVAKRLWFPNQRCSAEEVAAAVRDPYIHHVSLLAQPGSGKTGVIHCTMYLLMTPEKHTDARSPEKFTGLSGMADNDWLEQFHRSLSLQGAGQTREYIWTPLGDRSTNHCLEHRGNLIKRVNYLKSKPDLLYGHVFFIDEAHFAEASTKKPMTIEQALIELELTQEQIHQYNITIVYITATPGGSLNRLERTDEHRKVVLLPSPLYRGFEHFLQAAMIFDYDDEFGPSTPSSEPLSPDFTDKFETLVNQFRSPRYHFIRPNDRRIADAVERLGTDRGWRIVRLDSKGDNSLNVIANDESERSSDPSMRTYCTYERPGKHTVFMLLGKYRASKRLVLHPSIGLVIERPAKQQNNATTNNGLIPRLFGHAPGTCSSPSEFLDSQPAMFLCDLLAVQQYIALCNDCYDFDNKHYVDRTIRAKPGVTKETFQTYPTRFADEVPRTTFPESNSSCPIYFRLLSDSEMVVLADAASKNHLTETCKGILVEKLPTLYRNFTWDSVRAEKPDQAEKYGVPILHDRMPSYFSLIRRSKVPAGKSEADDLLRVIFDTTDGARRLIVIPWRGTATLQ